MKNKKKESYLDKIYKINEEKSQAEEIENNLKEVSERKKELENSIQQKVKLFKKSKKDYLMKFEQEKEASLKNQRKIEEKIKDAKEKVKETKREFVEKMKENIEIDKKLIFYQRSLGKTIFPKNQKKLEKFDEIYFYKQLELSNRELNIENLIQTYGLSENLQHSKVAASQKTSPSKNSPRPPEKKTKKLNNEIIEETSLTNSQPKLEEAEEESTNYLKKKFPD